MGGVYADSKPFTMPSIPGTLNRFSRCLLRNDSEWVIANSDMFIKI
jgi:hypothetical protein